MLSGPVINNLHFMRGDPMSTFTTSVAGVILLVGGLSWTAKSQVPNADAIGTNNELKKTGIEILNGKKIATYDTSLIYRLLDGVFVKDSAERAFYFKVFNEIDRQAKGEIAVVMDWKIKEFCTKYPNEFLALSVAEITGYSQRIGELFRTEEEFPVESAEKYISDIRKRTNPAYSDKVSVFSMEIMKKVKVERKN